MADEPAIAETAPGADDNAARPGRLLELTVTDLALIGRLQLTFGAGLNVITGETGAGKSRRGCEPASRRSLIHPSRPET
jgi:hypothetical protein